MEYTATIWLDYFADVYLFVISPELLVLHAPVICFRGCISCALITKIIFKICQYRAMGAGLYSLMYTALSLLGI